MTDELTCTAAERALIEAHMRWIRAMNEEEIQSALLERQIATNRVDTERTPKDPRDVFIERVRAHFVGGYSEVHCDAEADINKLRHWLNELAAATETKR